MLLSLCVGRGAKNTLHCSVLGQLNEGLDLAENGRWFSLPRRLWTFVGCCAIFLNEDNVKSLLCKMRIKTEDSMEAKATHHLETHAIYQTESPPRGSKYRSDSSTMRYFVYPFDVEERVHVCLKCTDGCHAKSMLYQSKSLNQDIIAARS